MKNRIENVYLVLDVGGTQIKGCLLDETGKKKVEIASYPAHSLENADIIMDNFALVIKELLGQNHGAPLAGIGMAFPGPFDYENGISLMKNLNKYDSIFGKPIEPEMKKRIPEIKNIKFCYLHDIEAFGIGESYFGEARDAHKILCLCIGTGAGSAFMENRIPLKTGEGIPKNGWLYSMSYKDSIIDDYISVRGLAKISRNLFGQSKTGMELSKLAGQQDKTALEVWSMFGRDLKESMLPVLESFHPDAVVLGGQIAKSFSYFGALFANECKGRKIKLHIETETSEKAMQGLVIKITG